MSKTLLTKILAVGIAASCATGAYADNLKGFYAGGGALFIDGNASDDQGGSVEFRALEAFGGYRYASWAGAEVRIGTGFSEESYARNTDTGVENHTLKISHFESIYYRPELVNHVAKLYGLMGLTNIQLSSNSASSSGSSSESGFSYGFGIGFVMKENLNLNFEYRELISTSDTQFTSLGITMDWRI